MAAASPVDICNMALDHLGKPSIVSLTENSVEASLLKRQYPIARRMTLARSPWTFARKIRALSALSDNPLEDTWTYRYDLPNDMLKLTRLLPERDAAMPNREPSASYVESGTIYTNEPSAKLLYIWDSEDTGSWSALFDDALALYLAVRMAPQMTRRRSDSAELAQAHTMALAEAIEMDAANETTTYTYYEDGYIDERGGVSETLWGRT